MLRQFVYQALIITRDLVNTQQKLLARDFFWPVNGSRPFVARRL